MKSILESSVYLIIFTLICYFSIDLIMLNNEVTDVNRVARYVENYIEAKGYSQTDKDGNRMLAEEVESELSLYCNKNGVSIVFGASDETDMYCYVNYTISYKLKSAMAGYDGVHEYSGLARYSS